MLRTDEAHFSYADLLTLNDDKRYELHEGVLVCMSPAPLRSHQYIVGELYALLRECFKEYTATAYVSPVDVFLFDDPDASFKDIHTVVQPDVLVVCDPDESPDRGVYGPPDLVIEVLSESTRRIDQMVKYDLYRRAGVPEYWIVNPQTETVAVFRLSDGQYYPAETARAENSISVDVCGAHCAISLKTVFH